MAAIELVSSFGAKRHHSFRNLLGGHVGSYHGARYLLKSLPNFWVLKLRARLVILILFLVSFPWIWSIFSPPITDTLPVSDASLYRAEPIHVEVLPLLFGDLKKEGLLRTNQKAIYITHANNEESIFFRDQTENDNEMEIIISSKDSKRQSSIPDDTIDFAFAPSFPTASEFIDRTLKLGGIMAFPLSQDLSIESIKKKSNYKIVYQRLFDETTMIAMRKTGQSETNPGTGRRLFGYAEEAKKAALENLEDVLLEPPRAASGKSNRYLKRTKYLPDLMGDSLESYPRRVFLDVGLPEKEGGSGSGWFGKNYPTRNKNFEMYKIETVTEEWSGKEVAQIGMSDWLEKNVREEEYVVMKGEAELVEEMVKSKAIRLVDELFLECKPHGQGGRGRGNRRRAYWECLALYGRLRDEGVAVHQWWG